MDITGVLKYGINPSIVEEYIEKGNSRDISIAVSGEFSSGKSTFINAFINKENFLPNVDEECTPVFVELLKSNDNRIEISYRDGSKQYVDLCEENIKKFTKYTDEYDENILGIALPVNSEYIDEDVRLIDTPGTNTIIKQHEAITGYILKRVDIVLYVINKVISNTDIQRIRDISKYTNNIIVIATHMDENIEGVWKNRNSNDIDRLVNDIRIKLIESDEKYENIEIFPIGSKSAYIEKTYIDEIRTVLKEYVDFNTQNMIKNRAKQQLKIVFEEEIDKIKNQVNVYETLKSSDLADINKKIKKLENIININKDKNEEGLENLQLSEDDLDRINNRIKRVFDLEASKNISKIVSKDNVIEEDVNKILNESLEKLGTLVRNIIEDQINNRIDIILDKSNEDIKNITKDIDIKIGNNISLKKPTIDKIDDLYLNDKINRIKQMKIECKDQIAASLDESNIIKEEIICKETNINSRKYQVEDLQSESYKYGTYVPEYDRIEETGGGQAGAIAGKLIGEVVDFAMLFADPVSKSLKVVDKMKDGTKVVKMIKDSAQKTAKVAKNVDKAVHHVSKTKTAISSLGILDKLDYLQVSFYGEKIGEKFGEFIKPTKTILVENEEKKEEFERQKSKILKNLMAEKYELQKLEKEREENLLSMASYRKKKADAQNKLEKLEREEKEILSDIEKANLLNEKSQIENYYKTNIQDIFEEESKNTTEIAIKMIVDLNDKLISKCNSMCEEKIINLKDDLEKMINKKDSIEASIKLQKGNLEELSNYEKWIEEWMC